MELQWPPPAVVYLGTDPGIAELLGSPLPAPLPAPFESPAVPSTGSTGPVHEEADVSSKNHTILMGSGSCTRGSVECDADGGAQGERGVSPALQAIASPVADGRQELPVSSHLENCREAVNKFDFSFVLYHS